MKTKLTIKNFRVFDSDGVTIDLNPITILTGCNSSGKSSITKAVLLLDSFLSQIRKDVENGDEIRLNEYKLDFTTYPYNLLGRFDKAVNKDSKIKEIEICYSTYSYMLSNDVDVQLVFYADKNDELNNGYLKQISMSVNDEMFYVSGKDSESWYNFNVIKEKCLEFIPTYHAVKKFCSLQGLYEFGSFMDNTPGISKEQYEKEEKEIIDFLLKQDKQCRRDVVHYIRYATHCKNNNVIPEYEQIIDWTKTNGSIFYIPILEQLKDKSKEEIKNIVTDKFVEGQGDGLKSATKKVLDSFAASDFDTFGDYFAFYENEFFEKNKFNAKDAPYLKSAKGIWGNYILAYPSPDDTYVSLGTEYISLGTKGEELVDSKKHYDDRMKSWNEMPITFSFLYEVVMSWNWISYKNDDKASKFYYNINKDFGSYSHYMLNMLFRFGWELIQEVCLPKWSGNVSFVSSDTASINRLYSFDNNDQFSNLLKRHFEARKFFLRQDLHALRQQKEYKIDSFINKWIKDFGIGDSISYAMDEEGLGVQIKLQKNKDGKVNLLADEGYGITQLISIILQIETAILSAKGEKVNSIYGLESLDKYDVYKFHYEQNTIVIEEPEIHLHPSYQSKLADMFAEAYNLYNIHFIIETHSEYLIRKLQVMVADEEIKLTSSDLSLNYSGKDKRGVSTNRKIGILDDGRLDAPFGPGFFDEADTLAMDILKYKARRK